MEIECSCLSGWRIVDSNIKRQGGHQCNTDLLGWNAGSISSGRQWAALGAHIATATGKTEQAGVFDIRVVVGMLSRPNRTTRQAIRDTWGGDRRLARVMFFILAPNTPEGLRELQDESRTYKDLVVVSDVNESYHTTVYALVQLNRVAAGIADRITHVLKRMRTVMSACQCSWRSFSSCPNNGCLPMLLAGRQEVQPVSRQPGWRWEVSRDNWPTDEPIKIVWGTAMVTTVDLVVLLAAGGVHLDHGP